MSYSSINDYIYNSWRKMHIRCYDVTYHSYHRYGGRGIRVCEAWHVYAVFKRDMEDSWFKGATVDREDNDGDYELDNCSWKSKTENTKPFKYDLNEILTLYRSGMKQRDVGLLFGLTQDRISKLLKKARSVESKLS